MSSGDDVERTSHVLLHTVHTHDDRYNLFQWPAAAVIPAPIAYIKVAAVKKLVVGFLMRPAWPAVVTRVSAGVVRLSSCSLLPSSLSGGQVVGSFTLNKLECFKQASAMNTLAWNNHLGLRFYFVGFES